MGRFFLPLILLFCFAFVATQAWLSQHRFDRTTYRWIGISFLGLVIAYLSAFVLGLSLSLLANLDPLQRSPDGTIVFTSATVFFMIILAVFQWFVLRESVSRPILQAALNAILGLVTYTLISQGMMGYERMIGYENIALGLPVSVVVYAVFGAGLGGVIHKILNSWMI